MWVQIPLAINFNSLKVKKDAGVACLVLIGIPVGV